MLNRKDKGKTVVMQRIECPACRRSAAFKQEHLDSLDAGQGCSIDECPHCNHRCCWIHRMVTSDDEVCRFSYSAASLSQSVPVPSTSRVDVEHRVYYRPTLSLDLAAPDPGVDVEQADVEYHVPLAAVSDPEWDRIRESRDAPEEANDAADD